MASKVLSVIIPVYNVETYVERCIRSLENQNLSVDEFEIVVVNDGSPDRSRDVVLGLMREFPNIILIDQPNQGVSRARNAGIAKASGRFLLFIDPDDYVEDGVLSDILRRVCKLDVQVLFLGYRFLNADGSTRTEVLNQAERGSIYTGLEAYVLSRGDGMTDPDRSVGVLFLRSFVLENDLWYVANVPYLEDGEFLARVLCLASACAFEGAPFYIRTTRPGSATNSVMILSVKALNGFFIAADNLKEFQKSGKLSNAQRIFLNQPIAKFTLLPFNVLAVGLKFLDYFKLVMSEQVKERKLDLNGVRKTYLRYGRVFNRSRILLLFYILFNVYQRTHLIPRKS